MEIHTEEDLPQGSPEWHEFRALRGMASEAACIMHASPWEPKTWLQLWEVKKGIREIKSNIAMRSGTANEPRARLQFAQDHKMDIVPMVCAREFERDMWTLSLGASLDGMTSDGIPVEIKCPYSGAAGDLWQAISTAPELLTREHINDVLPVHYWWQLQQQMLITGTDYALFYVWTEQDARAVSVERDNDELANLIDNWWEFMRLLREDIPPEPAPGDVIDREFDAEFCAAVDRWRSAKTARDTADTMMSAARDELIALAGDHSAQAQGVRVSRYWQNGGVQYKNIPELKEVDLDAYRAPRAIRYTVKEVN